MRRNFPGGRAVAAAVPFSLALVLALPCSPAEAQEEATTILDPLVVTATRTERPLSTVGSSLTLITAEDLENRQTTHVADILREVPGVAVVRQGGPGSLTEVRIRGAENNHTLVLIDGIEVNNPAGEAFFDFGHLLADDIERIEVLRGPQSVLYGSEAVGGVINIITRSGSGGPSVAGSAEGGSYGTIKANTSLSTGDDLYDLLVSATHFHTNGISQIKTPYGQPDSDGYKNTTAFAKLGLNPLENLRIDLVGRYTDYDLEYDSYNFDLTNPSNARPETRGEQAFGRAQATLDLLDGRWRQRAGMALSHFKMREYDRDVRGNSAVGKRVKFDYQSDFSFETPSIARAEHLVTLGLEHEKEYADLDGADIDANFTTRSIFGQYQLDLLERLSLTGGLRRDFNDEFDDATSYRLTAAYNLQQTGTRLHASYGTAVKNPTMTERYGFGTFLQPNPDLKPEKSRGWEAGVEQHLLDDRLTLGATYFDRRIKDLIAYNATFTSVENIDRARTRGVELTAKVEIMPGLTGRASYTYTDAEDDENEQLLRRPSHMASANLNYRFLDNRANLNLGLVYNGKSYDAGDTGRVSLGSYTLVNLAGSYRVTDNFEVFGRVENALSENYEEIHNYNTPGRAAYAGLRIKF